MCTVFCVHCLLSALSSVCTVFCVHCLLCALSSVCTVFCVHCLLSSECTVFCVCLLSALSSVCTVFCTVFCVHCLLCALSSVCTVFCVHCLLCALSSVCTVFCVHCLLCALSSVCTVFCVHCLPILVTLVTWGTVAQRLDRRTLNRENPCSNYFVAVSKLWQIRPPHVATVHSAVNEYLATDSAGYMTEKSSRSNFSVAECFPERWHEQVCQGVKFKAL